ncbi:hypothetical protein [Tsukamurella sp. USMM236]|uniref:hypothetical protein n=1 Tax=Tsukamurella sp. USMM236 TaxID=3081301 RepID=UPI0030191751
MAAESNGDRRQRAGFTNPADRTERSSGGDSSRGASRGADRGAGRSDDRRGGGDRSGGGQRGGYQGRTGGDRRSEGGRGERRDFGGNRGGDSRGGDRRDSRGGDFRGGDRRDSRGGDFRGGDRRDNRGGDSRGGDRREFGGRPSGDRRPSGSGDRRSSGPGERRDFGGRPSGDRRSGGGSADRRGAGPGGDRRSGGGSYGSRNGSGSRPGGQGGRSGGFQRDERSDRPRTRAGEPSIPKDVDPKELDPAIRRDLLSLDKNNAELVSSHLVLAGRLLDSDPAAALAHARAARERAGRIAAVREACGIAAYMNGEWSEALSELRAAKRMGGTVNLLPMIADSERGLGRPEKAIETARGDEAAQLTGDDRTELRMVEAGARMDLGEYDKAVVTLQAEDLDPARRGFHAARLFYVYAEALLGAERRDDALTWFLNAAAADEDEATDAEERVAELSADDSAE